MTTAMRRCRLRVLLLAGPLAAVSLAAAACNPPMHAGAAATIGSATIPTSTLAAVVGRAEADPAAAQAAPTPADLTRIELTLLIQHQLLVDLAHQHGITVTQQDVEAEQASLVAQAGSETALESEAASQLATAPGDLPRVIEDQYLRIALANALTAAIPVPEAQLAALYQQNVAQFDQVDAAQIVVSSQALATQIYAQAKAAPATFAALARQYSIDTSTKNNGGNLGFSGPGSYPAPIDHAVFTSPVGAIVGPIQSQAGWYVLDILAKRSETLAQATPGLRAQILATQQQTALTAAVTALAVQDHVDVNPQFGVWQTDQVVATPQSQELASPAPGTQPSAVTGLGGG
ncbi:MAG: peptidylprolyl isomerase [Mycobacteriales bacterium]